MNSLKMALSTESRPSKDKDKEGANASLLKGVNKSKSQSMWALDMDNGDQVTEESLDTDNLLRILNSKLEAAFKKDSKSISEITFLRIIEEFQEDAGGSKSELAYLMVIEDKLTDILEFARPDLKPFLVLFNQMLTAKIAKMRKKEKKAELNNFDYIVNHNFKKKAEQKAYLKIQQPKPSRNSKEKVRKSSKSSHKANGSIDNKLNRLFSKQKNNLKERTTKDSAQKEDEEAGYNATTKLNHDESISFSTALATTMTVKTRKRKNSNDKKQKVKKPEETNDDKEDQAFMFFRPKKHKK